MNKQLFILLFILSISCLHSQNADKKGTIRVNKSKNEIYVLAKITTVGFSGRNTKTNSFFDTPEPIIKDLKKPFDYSAFFYDHIKSKSIAINKLGKDTVRIHINISPKSAYTYKLIKKASLNKNTNTTYSELELSSLEAMNKIVKWEDTDGRDVSMTIMIIYSTKPFEDSSNKHSTNSQ